METPHGQTFQCRVTSEAVTKVVENPVIEYEEEAVDTGQEEPRQKILIQRVFQQTKKNVVEQKLDYVLATSDEEITNYVFGDVFRKKVYAYYPQNYCLKHDPELPEHTDETLLRIGDKFDSLETFRLYIDSHAKHWKYYLRCADSHKKYGNTSFVYRCVFADSKHQKYFNVQGLRKRTPKISKGNCPCRVILRAVVENSETLTVLYVCHHHDHALTDEDFNKLQHGRRIHPSVKEEIMDLLALDVERAVVKKYFESLTGHQMNMLYFQNILQSMKANNIERQFSLEKLKEISRKVGKIKEELGLDDGRNYEDETVDDINLPDKASQIQEAINVLRSVAAPKRYTQKPSRKVNSGRKRTSKVMNQLIEEATEMSPPVSSKSRLETRLQELTYDHETLQSIKNLQDSVRGETDERSQVHSNQEPWNRSITGHRKKRIKNAQKQTEMEHELLEPQTIIIENTQNVDGYEQNQEIVYENEVTVMETPVENTNEIVVYENQDENFDTVNNEYAEDSYCIYAVTNGDNETSNVTEEQPYEDFILMENLENIPEVHIKATKLARVSIVSKNDDNINQRNDTEDKQDESKQIVDTNSELPSLNENENETPLVDSNGDEMIEIKAENIKVLSHDPNIGLKTDAVYELINTNDKKILPDHKIIRNAKLKKTKAAKRMEEINRMSLLNEETLNDLDDDECYMVVVNNDDSLDDTLRYEDDSYPIEELDASESEELIEAENLDENVIYYVNKKVQCTIVSSKDIDKEMKTISRLKRMRHSLEQDVKKLASIKDGLVKDIMKSKRGTLSNGENED